MELFNNLGLAIAFSPRLEALLFEASRLKTLLGTKLTLIHVGHTDDTGKKRLFELMEKAGLVPNETTIRWEQGKPGKRILAVCREEKVDLLVAGAIKKENLLQYYIGSVARRILRKADCSVLTLLNPSTTPKPYANIVVSAENSPYVNEALQVACVLGTVDRTDWIHIAREIKLYGLTMATAGESTEAKYEDYRNSTVQREIENVKAKLEGIPHEGLKINYKILAGKSGYELARFTALKKADLLIVGAPQQKFSFFDRFFTHDLEYIFADLPSNLLIINPAKKSG